VRGHRDSRYSGVVKHARLGLLVLTFLTVASLVSLETYFMDARYPSDGLGCGNCRASLTRDLWYLLALPTGVLGGLLAGVVAIRERSGRLSWLPNAALLVVLGCMVASRLVEGRAVVHTSRFDVLASWAGFSWWILVFALGFAGRPFGIACPDFFRSRWSALYKAPLLLCLLFVVLMLYLQAGLDFAFMPGWPW